MRNFVKILMGLMFSAQWMSAADLSINEVMPCNISTYMDRDLFNFSGYIEFYNSGASNIDLKGYRISHEKRTGKGVYSPKWQWTITESVVVPAGGYKLIFFDKANRAGHCIYKLDSDGGKIFLYNSGGSLVSSITYPALLAHVAFGPEGYMDPSPLKENTLGVQGLSMRCQQPAFSGATPGVQNGNVSLSLTCSTSGSTIYYTTDGTEPSTSNGKKYSNPISINTNTVIRARAYADGYISSPILTGSFIYSDAAHESCGGFTVPIVSIVVNKKYFNDDSIGICVKGVNGAPITASCLGTGKANFMQDWSRPVSFEYIVNGKQALSHEAEVGVMGGCSRGYDVKSLKIKAGKKLGSANETFDYDFFLEKSKNKYKSVHLRNGGNAYDPEWVRCRDAYMQSLAKVMDVDYQAYEPVAYYINGKYQGLMGLRERTNEDYVEANYGLDDEDIDLLKLTNNGGIEATTGDDQAYNEMISFVETANPTSPNFYEQASKYIDMNEYIDYQIFEQFIVNTDWPGNNCKLWREKINGRFRWIVFDTDFGLGLYDATANNYCDVTMNSIEWCTGTGSKINWSNGTKSGSTYKSDDASQWKVTLFKHLMENETFRQKFLNRSLIHLGTTFTSDRVNAVWDSLSAKVKKEYCASFDYNNDLTSLSKAKSMVQFAKDRPNYMYSYLKDYYGLGSAVNLEISSNVASAHLMMNDELINLPSFNGKYFTGKELKLEAIAPLGYTFDHWELGEGGVSESLLDEKSQWKYFYQETGFTSTDWTAATYDDNTWETGYGKMGYGAASAVYNTTLDYGSDPENKYVTAYFRNKFTLSDPSELKNLNFSMVYDDAYILYINGHEVKRENIEGEVDYSTFAVDYRNDEEVSFKLDQTSSAFQYLVNGVNTIAVEIHQNVANSSDLTFQLSVTANYESGAAVGTLSEPIITTTVGEDKAIKAIFKKITNCPNLPLLITEISPSNNGETDIVDEYGNHPDWFEVYNKGAETINLAGLYLTDNPAKPQKSQIPYGYEETKLAPGEHIVFWADNKSFRGARHVDFKLSNSAKESYLYLFAGCDTDNPIDMVSYVPMSQNSSYGRIDDISETWDSFTTVCNGIDKTIYLPTPGVENGSLTLSCEQETTETYENISESNVLLYPNPAHSALNIEVADENLVRIVIYDQLGRSIYFKEAKGYKTVVNVEALPIGTYYMQIETENDVYRRPFVKR